MDRIEAIRQRITDSLAPASLDITDDSHLHKGHAGAASGAGHFTVNVIAEAFKDKSLIERHRMIYQAVDDLMRTEIHALSIQAKTPEEE